MMEFAYIFTIKVKCDIISILTVIENSNWKESLQRAEVGGKSAF